MRVVFFVLPLQTRDNKFNKTYFLGIPLASKAFNRLKRIVIISLSFAAFIAFLIICFNRYMMYFVKPTELLQSKDTNSKVRLGGVVQPKSFVKEGFTAYFNLTDGQTDIKVRYNGVLPSLFREGQTIIAEGQYDRVSQIFKATLILAKHDERYVPKSVQDKLNKKREGK